MVLYLRKLIRESYGFTLRVYLADCSEEYKLVTVDDFGLAVAALADSQVSLIPWRVIVRIEVIEG